MRKSSFDRLRIINPPNHKTMKSILITLALAASAALLHAQPEGGAPPRPDGPPPGAPGGPGGPGGPDGMRRPVPPLLAALDTDKDGEISSKEIDNAVTALKTLDKDGDGKISKEELRPPMPPRREGEGQPRGPRPEGGGQGGPQGGGPRPPRGPGGPPPSDR